MVQFRRAKAAEVVTLLPPCTLIINSVILDEFFVCFTFEGNIKGWVVKAFYQDMCFKILKANKHLDKYKGSRKFLRFQGVADPLYYSHPLCAKTRLTARQGMSQTERGLKPQT